MHILSKLIQSRISSRPLLYRYLTVNKALPLINKTTPKQIFFTQQIRFNQIDSVWRNLRKTDPLKLKIKDGVPEFYHLIYRNTMYRYFYSAQILSTILGIMTVLIIPLLYDNDGNKSNIYEELPSPATNEALIMASLLLCICIVLQIALRKCPMRIYNLPKSKKYVFVFYGSWPLSIRKLPVEVNDLYHLNIESAVIPWTDCYYKLNNYSNIILIDNYFRKPADLYIMLGVQKNDDLED